MPPLPAATETAAGANGAPAVQPTPSVLFSFQAFHIVLLALTGLMAILLFAQVFRMLPVTGDNMYPESAGAVDAQRWAQGLPLYADYRQPPFLITHFPPLWYAVLEGAAKLGFGTMDAIVLWGRVFNLICLFAVVVLGYRWNRRAGLAGALAVLTATFYLSFPILVPWAVTARPDFPGLFFAFLAVYLVGVRASGKHVFYAAIAAALAILCRHNGVAAPVSIVAWLVWSKRIKHAALFCAVVAALVGPVMAYFQATTGMVLLNLSSAKFGPLAFTYARDVIFRLLSTPGYTFVTGLAVFGVIGLLESWKQPDHRGRLLGMYLAAAGFFAILGSAAAGAAVNHYLETAFALAVLVPPGVAAMRKTWKNGSALSALPAVFAVVLLAPSLDLQRWNLMHPETEDLRRVARLMENKAVFTDIPYLAARNQSAQFTDPVSLTYTERKPGPTAWSSTSLAGSLKNRTYDLVILYERADEPYNPAALYPRYPRLDGSIRLAVQQNYQLCFELDKAYIYGRLTGAGSSVGNGCPAPIASFTGSSAAPPM
jgi:hypothetical protein